MPAAFQAAAQIFADLTASLFGSLKQLKNVVALTFDQNIVGIKEIILRLNMFEISVKTLAIKPVSAEL